MRRSGCHLAIRTFVTSFFERPFRREIDAVTKDGIRNSVRACNEGWSKLNAYIVNRSLINAIRAMIFFDCYLPRVLQETPIGRTMRSAWNMDRLSGPFSCGMGCDVEVNCTTPVMRQ